MRAAVVLATVSACYRAPATNSACAIVCDDTCPQGQCINGYCVGEGQTCAPTFPAVRAGNGVGCGLDTRDHARYLDATAVPRDSRALGSARQRRLLRRCDAIGCDLGAR